jgi:hypothetical protein
MDGTKRVQSVLAVWGHADPRPALRAWGVGWLSKVEEFDWIQILLAR